MVSYPNPYHDLYERLVLASPALDPERLSAIRKKLIWSYSWAVPSPEAIALIAREKRVIEVGCGTGYWAWLIAQAGGSVVAYDREPHQAPRWFEIQEWPADYQQRTDCLSQHQDRALFLCWPPLNESMAFETLQAYRGNTVIYVGEWRGRTADASFHDELEKRFTRENETAIPNWPGFSDRISVWKAKRESDSG